MFLPQSLPCLVGNVFSSSVTGPMGTATSAHLHWKQVIKEATCMNETLLGSPVMIERDSVSPASLVLSNTAEL